MAQYRIGLVSTTASSNVVNAVADSLGNAPQFTSFLSPGDGIIIGNDTIAYTVATVASDTQITLTTNYPTTQTNVPYIAYIAFTANFDLPLISPGDIRWTFQFNEAMRKIDLALGSGGGGPFPELTVGELTVEDWIVSEGDITANSTADLTNTSCAIALGGSDPSTAYWGQPVGMFWSNPKTGSGRVLLSLDGGVSANADLGIANLYATSATLTTALAIGSGGTGSTTASGARTNLGLGSMAVVNSPVPIANGGTGSTTAANARAALGLGDIATQNAGSLTVNLTPLGTRDIGTTGSRWGNVRAVAGDFSGALVAASLGISGVATFSRKPAIFTTNTTLAATDNGIVILTTPGVRIRLPDGLPDGFWFTVIATDGDTYIERVNTSFTATFRNTNTPASNISNVISTSGVSQITLVKITGNVYWCIDAPPGWN